MATSRSKLRDIFGTSPPPADDSVSKELTQHDRLQLQLYQLKAQKMELKNKLAEEKLTYLMTTSFADAIPDPQKQKAVDMEQVQQQIIDHLTAASESRYVQTVISHYRLSGCSTFTFQDKYLGIRLDTYYNKRYYEPYYLFLPKNDPSTIEQHTMPLFIPTSELAKAFLPNGLNSMLQILLDMLLAFVSRREQIKALKNHVDKMTVKIKTFDASMLSLGIIRRQDDGQIYCINIKYTDLSSIYPTKVNVKIVDTNKQTHDLPGGGKPIVDAFKSRLLLHAYQFVF